MIRRILPVAEWPRLADTELGSVLPLCDPQTTTVLVVEDGEQIVGQWALLLVPHVEGLGIHPDHQHNAAVARHLWKGMRQIVAAHHFTRVMTHAIDPAIGMLLETAGAEKLDGSAYVLPMEVPCRQQ